MSMTDVMSSIDDDLLTTIANLLDKKLSSFHTKLLSDMNTLIEEKIAPVWTMVNDVTKKQESLKGDLSSLESNLSALEKRIVELEGEKTRLTAMVQDSLWRNNDIEQYMRKFSFRVTGAKQEAEDSCTTTVQKLLCNKLGLSSVQASDIAIAHPLPRPGSAPSDDPPPIYFRLANLGLRQNILTNRKRLKNSGITIRDDLTRLNLQLLNRATNSELVESCWYQNGKVLFKPEGGTKVLRLLPYQDITEIIRASGNSAKGNNVQDRPGRKESGTLKPTKFRGSSSQSVEDGGKNPSGQCNQQPVEVN